MRIQKKIGENQKEKDMLQVGETSSLRLQSPKSGKTPYPVITLGTKRMRKENTLEGGPDSTGKTWGLETFDHSEPFWKKKKKQKKQEKAGGTNK